MRHAGLEIFNVVQTEIEAMAGEIEAAKTMMRMGETAATDGRRGASEVVERTALASGYQMLVGSRRLGLDVMGTEMEGGEVHDREDGMHRRLALRAEAAPTATRLPDLMPGNGKRNRCAWTATGTRVQRREVMLATRNTIHLLLTMIWSN